MVEICCEINNVLAPIRADADAASHPAWPPPITITSYFWGNVVKFDDEVVWRDEEKKWGLKSFLKMSIFYFIMIGELYLIMKVIMF